MMIEIAGELKLEEATPGLIALLAENRRHRDHQADH
jgi:hypothetical protein